MLLPTLLLLSHDDSLAALVEKASKTGWRVAQHRETHATHSLFAEPNVRVVILDDEAVDEHDRGRLLAQIRRRLPTASLLYIAGGHNEDNEKRARTGGAHYYVSKPLAPERFHHILASFMRSHEAASS